MLRLTIDDREVLVPPGATVLDAAQQLGIEIPTLCFLRGYEPSTSCQVCLVRDRRTKRYWPACATPAAEGMQIESDSADVFAMRKTALELLLSNHAGDCRAPCWFACPAHMDIPLMLRELQQHELRDAITTIKRDIALPAVLGRVCSKPCEKGCRRCQTDDAVAVCELKRYVADEDLASSDPYCPLCAPPTGKRVVIVGGGPTGLSATFYLRQLGHACELWEAQLHLGGRLRDASYDTTLPRQVLNDEIAQILRLGVDVRTNQRLVSREQLDKLCQDFDAVLITCGALEEVVVDPWGLKRARKGIDVAKGTFATSRSGVFAAGNALRGTGMVVRSVADGKEVAHVIDRFLRRAEKLADEEIFSSRLGPLRTEELAHFVAGAGTASRALLAERAEILPERAADQAARCFACDCSAHGKCKLEHYARIYGAESGRFGNVRPLYEVIGRHGAVQFEPGKCIKCELCIQIASRAGEPLGLAFVGRGFDVRLAVPFDRGLDEGLTRVAEQCVAACPTGSLSMPRRTPHLDLTIRTDTEARSSSGSPTLPDSGGQ